MQTTSSAMADETKRVENAVGVKVHGAALDRRRWCGSSCQTYSLAAVAPTALARVVPIARTHLAR